MFDDLLYYQSNSEKARAMGSWFESFDHGCLCPDYHRLQIEHWLWRDLHRDQRFTLDIAQNEVPRAWLEMPRYYTFGLEDSDIIGDLLAFPISEVDVIICTEVLEHCADPMSACREMFRALSPGGVLYCAAPFCWPEHGLGRYPDYWRFTEQAWELMLSDFSELKIEPVLWTDEGRDLYDLLRRFEGMGYKDDGVLTTGYMVTARKAARRGV